MPVGDMNFNADGEVRIAIQGAELTVEKLNPASGRPRSPGGNRRGTMFARSAYGRVVQASSRSSLP